ncbi:hypothetical protein LTR85_000815 [Meristemomyces frigidus]|nr:hypothetical protein LTR85_000815 [Meristemomyces frigidus]
MSDTYNAPLGTVHRDPTRLARRGGGPYTPSTRQPIASGSGTGRGTRDGTLSSYWQSGGQQEQRAPVAQMGLPSRAASTRPEPVTPSAPTRMPTNPPLPTGTQESLSSEDARVIQAQVDLENQKRDQQDPDFTESQPSPKRARVDSASATPTTPLSVKRRGRGTKRFVDCSKKTQKERVAEIKIIGKNWKVSHAEWMPEGLMPTSEPRDWGVPLLTALRRLSDIAPGRDVTGVTSARRAMSTAWVERTEGGDSSTKWVTVDDVKQAINALAPMPAPIARSPTLAPAAILEPATPLVVRSTSEPDDAPSSDAYHDTTADPDQLPSPTSPEQVTNSSRRAGKQAVKVEPGAASSSSGARSSSSAPPADDDLEDTYARIEEICKLRADEEKARARRLVLEHKQKRWVALQSRGSGRDDAIAGETIGD